MYLSHAVRTIRDDPMADESVDLVVTLAEEADDAAEATGTDADDSAGTVTDDSETLDVAVADLGGEVVTDLQFSAVHVRLPETAVADLCALDGIERIETAETLRLVGDETTESAAATQRDPDDDASRRPDHEREQ